MDELRPDPMQTFYLRQGRTSRPAEFLEDHDPQPSLPLGKVQVRWSGFLWLGGFVALVALISRLLGVLVAEVVAAAGLLGLALTVLLSRSGHRIPMFDAMPWMGDVSSDSHVHAHVDVGHFDGGGGGDGGGG
jgi:hypothetical protein